MTPVFHQPRTRAAILAFAMIASVAATAERSLLDIPLEELGNIQVETVDSVSRFTQKVTEAPASVTVLRRDEIQKLGYRTVAEALNGVRGLDTTYDHLVSRAGIRGYNDPDDYGNRMLLLVDGHRINDPVYDSVPIDRDSLVPIDLVERIEVVRGPAASVYGANPLFGVINIVTRRGSHVRGLEVSGDWGTHDSSTGRVTYGGEWKGLELLLSAHWHGNGGDPRFSIPYFRGHPEGNRTGIALGRDAEEARGVYGSLNYKGWFLRGSWADRIKDDPTGSFAAVFDLINYHRNQRGFVEGGYTGQIGGGWRLDARGYFDTYRNSASLIHRVPRFVLDPDFRKPGVEIPRPPFAFPPGPFGGPGPGFFAQFEDVDVRTNAGAASKTYGADITVDRNLGERVTLSLGAGWRHVERMSIDNVDQSPWRVNLATEDSYDALSAMIATRVAIAKNFWLDGALRYDWSQAWDGETSTRIGAVWAPDEKSAVKLVYGTAFRPPNFIQRGFNIPGFTGNPALDSEHIESWELILERQLGPGWRAAINGYHTRVRDTIRIIEPVPFQRSFINSDGLEMRGIEAEIEGRFGNGWVVRGSYGYQEIEEAATARRLQNAPRNIAKAQVIAPVYKDKIFLGLESLYTSQRQTLLGGTTGDHWTLNATLFGKEILPGLDLSASIYNLLDQDNEVPGAEQHEPDTLPGRGREFRLKLDYKF